jgi:thioredoxin-related protein
MRYIVTALVCAMLLPLGMMADPGAKGKKKKKAAVEAVNDKEIQWMTIEQAEAAMAKKPKKVWIDVYTGWCGWCKVMDRKTFAHPEVIKYINQNYYAIKLDAEQQAPITFQGKVYNFRQENGVHELAVQLLQGRMGYPSSVIMNENFGQAYVFAGYQNVGATEGILRYFHDGTFKQTTYEQYAKVFVPTWKELPAEAQPAAPAGH